MTTRTLEGVGEELIECSVCKKVLNGFSLWITTGADDALLTLCEECYLLHKVEPEEKGEQ